MVASLLVPCTLFDVRDRRFGSTHSGSIQGLGDPAADQVILIQSESVGDPTPLTVADTTRSPRNGWDTDDWRYAPYDDTRAPRRNTVVWVLGGIVVLYSAVTPGAYAQEIASALAMYPGASYLRTDMACASLRARRERHLRGLSGVGFTRQELCADVRAAGPPAYGRWLDTTCDPSVLVTC